MTTADPSNQATAPLRRRSTAWEIAGLTDRATALFATGDTYLQIANTLSVEFNVRLSRSAVASKAVSNGWVSIYGVAGQIHKHPEYRAKQAVMLAARCRALNADEDLQSRRIAATRSTKRDKLLDRGLLPEELDLYRSIRSKHLKAQEAAELIIASRRAAA